MNMLNKIAISILSICFLLCCKSNPVNESIHLWFLSNDSTYYEIYSDSLRLLVFDGNTGEVIDDFDKNLKPIIEKSFSNCLKVSQNYPNLNNCINEYILLNESEVLSIGIFPNQIFSGSAEQFNIECTERMLKKIGLNYKSKKLIWTEDTISLE